MGCHLYKRALTWPLKRRCSLLREKWHFLQKKQVEHEVENVSKMGDTRGKRHVLWDLLMYSLDCLGVLTATRDRQFHKSDPRSAQETANRRWPVPLRVAWASGGRS